jgi:hypothetical protein
VKLLSIDSEALTIGFVMEKGEPVSISFNSQEDLDKAYKEWVELTESIYGPTRGPVPNAEPGVDK